ncbi:MAG: 1-acyl-sn-glycerol-3-phosphate acyltransferase [Desulfovibrionaceae bacterium]|nr:1-acyl-sn-glycerol-3-phosphate acyltransferase [Desulfovibrionaceae bacterium]
MRSSRAGSIIFFSILLLWSALLAPVGWILYLLHALTKARAIRRWARLAGWIYGRSSLLVLRPFIKVNCQNPREGMGKLPCIITANHQSILDLYLLGFQGVTQVCPVTKSWPFRLLLPFTAVMRTAGYIEAEGHPVEQVARECRQRLKEGAALVFYPEGQRSRDGRLGRFHSGAFQLALKENVPIVPMVIKNSGTVIKPGSFSVFPGTVEMEMLPAIMPSAYGKFRQKALPHRALLKHVHQLYQEKLQPCYPEGEGV